MTSPCDDGSDIIALARSIGLAGIRPRSTDHQSKAASPSDIKPAAPPDGSDVIALARAVGLAGIPPAREFHPIAQTVTAPAVSPAGDGSDVIALARAIGLAGIRPAGERDQGDSVQSAVPTAANRDGSDIAPLLRGVERTSARSNSARPTLTVANSDDKVSMAARPPISASSAPAAMPFTYVQFQIDGRAGLKEAAEWTSRHGSLVHTTEAGDLSLVAQTSNEDGYRHVIFRAPSTSKARGDLARVQGNVTSANFRVCLLSRFDRQFYHFQGSAVHTLSALALSLREPPELPGKILAALINRA